MDKCVFTLQLCNLYTFVTVEPAYSSCVVHFQMFLFRLSLFLLL